VTQLSPHFTLEEMTRTGHAGLQAENIIEAQKYHGALKALCVTLLEPIRAKFGPVRVSSGFRGAKLTDAVGSKPTSQHCKGEAADFTVSGVKCDVIVEWIATESGLPFGQLILEQPSASREWVHISLGEPYRAKEKSRQVLHFNGKTYTPLSFTK
jgi:zinc D-Ala-D-Ala carboxypeptidase